MCNDPCERKSILQVHMAQQKFPDLRGMPFPHPSTLLSIMMVHFRISQGFSGFWSQDPLTCLKAIDAMKELFFTWVIPVSIYCVKN